MCDTQIVFVMRIKLHKAAAQESKQHLADCPGCDKATSLSACLQDFYRSQDNHEVAAYRCLTSILYFCIS